MLSPLFGRELHTNRVTVGYAALHRNRLNGRGWPGGGAGSEAPITGRNLAVAA